MKRYYKHIKPYKIYFILGPTLMLAEVFGEIWLPSFMANIINIGAANKDIAYIVHMGIIMIITALLMMLGGVGGAYFAAKASVSFSASLRDELFQKIQKFSFSNMDTFSNGSLITRLTNDITQIQNVLMMALRMLLRAPGMLIGAIIMAFIMNASLAAILLIVTPVLALIIGLIIKTAFPRFELMQKKMDRMNATIQEALTNVRVIKSFVRGTYEEDKYRKSNEELMDSSIRAFKVVILQMPVVTLFMNMATMAVVWVGGRQIMNGTMQAGDLTAFTTYIIQVLISLMMLAMVLLQSSRAIASLKRVNEVIDTIVDITEDSSCDENNVIENGKIEFKNVQFRYYKDNKEKVLDDISFVIQSGETLGIIGSTGCGKSTLVQLIPRLYDIDEGIILIDDKNVKEYTLKNLRNGVGMVLQKNILFSGSILENLKWGDPDASIEEIEEAAHISQSDIFIENFTDKYETNLGQGGVNISGGQKQRLCIARALLKMPKILILDDSTSAVDTATEKRIRENFGTLYKDITKIIIAQRISSVMEADRIMVMDEGKIVGIGNHEDMLSECKQYQEIYYSQMEKDYNIRNTVSSQVQEMEGNTNG